MDYTNEVRRIELKLREKYPTIRTEIFWVTEGRYRIVIKEYLGDFEEISHTFKRSICPLHLYIEISEMEPDVFVAKISPINDDEIPLNFSGIFHNAYTLKNLIECQVPEVNVVSVTFDDNTKTLILEVNGDKNQYGYVHKVTKNAGFGTKIEVVESTTEISKIKPPENSVFFIHPSRELSAMQLPFLRRDEALWFDNVKSIYNGTFKKEDLYFYKSEEKACYINFSIFNHRNIRNQLLMYDTIYCSLPLMGELENFFKEQGITRKEFLYLASKSRVKVIINQPEMRHQYDLFREIFEINQNAIISRRALAALCAIDIVSISNNYILNDPEVLPFVKPLIRAIADVSGSDPNAVERMMMWPNSAVRASFEPLHESSSKRISNYGVNNIVLNSAPQAFNNKFNFEFVVNAESIRIAHALNATYFPHLSDVSGYSDEPFVLMMGNLLNHYTTFTKDHLADTIQTEILKESGIRIIDPIKVIETNTYLPIQEFEAIAGTKYIRKGFKSLFDELGQLENDERNDRIRHYNFELEELLGYEGFKGGAFDLGTDAIGLPLFGIGKRIGTFIYSKIKERSDGFLNFAEKMEEIANLVYLVILRLHYFPKLIV